MKRRRASHAWLAGAALLATAACSETPLTPTSAFSRPIDFAYACEGAGRTVAPENDETAASTNATRMCADILEVTSSGAQRTVQGDLLGAVLNQYPPGVLFVQMNPASGDRTVIDSDLFVPGHTPVPVGEDPIRILRASDWGAFYVVSAGSRDVTKIIAHGYDGRELTYTKSTFPLPGAPAEAAIRDGRLFVAGAWEPVLWVFDLSMDQPPAAVVQLPDAIHTLLPLGDGFVATWKSRPVVSLLDGNGQPLSCSGADCAPEAGLTEACSDSLDNDGDGLADQADPDCFGVYDDDESGAAPIDPVDPATLEPVDSEVTAAQCQDGVDNDGDQLVDEEDPGCLSLCEDSLDNDGDGLTDAADPGCDDPDVGERFAECGDKIDNDGDGLTDTDDTACYTVDGASEGHFGPFGPYLPTVVEAGDIGTFVYVLDQRDRRISVHEVVGGQQLVPIRVYAHEDPGAEIPYRLYGKTEERTLGAIRTAAVPALDFRETTRLMFPSYLTNLSATRMRGELWDRIIEPPEGSDRPQIDEGLSSSGLYTPPSCDKDELAVCLQPLGDNDSWYVFAPRQDGKWQVIQSIYRGRQRHRLAQKKVNPGERGWKVDAPLLYVDGVKTDTHGEVLEGYPALGPVEDEEALVEKVCSGGVDEDEDGYTDCDDADCSDKESCGEFQGVPQPPRARRYGVWPPLDYEPVLTEVWYLTYEGAIAGTAGRLGRLLADDEFYAPGQRFCERGVEVGDWLQVGAAPASLPSSLHYELPVYETDGTPCPIEPYSVFAVEARVTKVGQDRLWVDPLTARQVPYLPTLSEELSGSQAKRCREALADVREIYQVPDDPTYGFPPTAHWKPESFPARVGYSVKGGDVWIAWGTTSGYLHPWRWDEATGECVERGSDELSPLVRGRAREAEFLPGMGYSKCPPEQDLERAAVADLFSTANRFRNVSFELDIFPACGNAGDTILYPGTQRETRWVFKVTGPDDPLVLEIGGLGGVGLATRLPILDFRRELVHMDAGGNRLALVRYTPGNLLAGSSPLGALGIYD